MSMNSLRFRKFLRSKSAAGLGIYLLFCAALSVLAGFGFYHSKLASFRQQKTEEKITALQLVDAFVTTYSTISSQMPEAPVPASFRAHAIERFNKVKGSESDFTLRWVGRKDREIVTAPADAMTASAIEEFAATTGLKSKSEFMKIGRQNLFRTLYPSIAHEQSCVDCHNALQPNNISWRLNDVMGAFVIDVTIDGVLGEIKRESTVFGGVFFLALAAVGVAFSFLHFGQMEAAFAAEAQLNLRVDLRTAELHDARVELISKHQSDIRYLEWLRRLAAFLRHEVRQPVAQITSSIELIHLAHRDDASIQPYVQSATRSAQHVWNLVERASRATDAEAFVRQSQPHDVDLAETIKDLVASYRQTHSGIDFTCNGPRFSRVKLDPMLLKEAVGNLLTNASSFANEGSVITVSHRSDPYNVTVDVINEGPLLIGDPESLFGPFASTRSGPSSEHHGLGLYLVRLVAEHYGGRALISNHENRGVIASIVIPTDQIKGT